MADASRWNGLCPAGKHGLDVQGQRCDRCPRDPVAELVEAATLYMVAHPCHASEGPCETERRLDVAIRAAKEAKR